VFTRTKDWMADGDFSEAEPKPAEHLYDIGPIHGKHRDETGSFHIGPSEQLLRGIELVDNDPVLGPFRSYIGKHNDHSDLVHLSENPDLVALVKKESNARSYVRKFPFIVQKAEGCTLTDVDGNRFLDFLGCAGTLALGHNHPIQTAAMMRVMKAKMPLQILDMASAPKTEFMSELFQFLPVGMSEDFRVQFCGGSGSDAVDAAVKVCKTATGRATVLCFHGAYHGHGQGPLAMMGNLGSKGPVQGLMPGVGFLPFPNNYRQPFGLATGEGGEGDRAVLKYIEHMLNDDESGVTKPACIVLEVVQGEGGLNAMSNWALQELRRITAENDIPLICDEIQSGFCRSGQKFAFEHSGIVPDVVCLSKAIGGSQPMACIVYNKKLDTWGPGAHTGTFRGNGLAFASGAATLRYMRENKLWEQAEAKGQLLKSLLLGKSPYIGDIRGYGLMLGVEFIDPAKKCLDGNRSSSGGAICGQVQVECLKRGLIIEKGGRGGSVLRPLPPLIVTDAEIRQAAGIILEAIAAAALKIGC
jgi:diaminobutyrate-2-oxoglutarate transaminase